MDQIIAAILRDNYTLLELNRRIKLLKILVTEKIFSFNDTISTDLSKEDSKWMEGLGEDFYQQFTKDNVNKIFKDLANYLKTMNVLTIYISFELPEEEKLKLGVWLRKEFGTNFVYEIRLDPSLIGGCALVWKGVYRDFSMRTIVQAKRDEILSSFKQYFK